MLSLRNNRTRYVRRLTILGTIYSGRELSGKARYVSLDLPRMLLLELDMENVQDSRFTSKSDHYISWVLSSFIRSLQHRFMHLIYNS